MIIRQFFLAVILSIIGLTASAQDPKTYYNISDDGYAIVPIPFGFPYFGRVFTHSIFFDNGLVSFYDPVTENMRLGGQNYFAQPLSNNIGSNFHYSIMPLWTDLRNESGSYYTQTNSESYLRYTWENISQYGYPDRLNTFDLEIRPTGFIGINYTKINIGGYPITAGLVGNAQLGEWNQHYYKPPQDIASISSIQNWSVPYSQGTDCSNPLNNQYCPGYQQAFFEQQCSINTLYDPACPGYTTAYYNYQCSVNALYHTGCQGYAQAFLTQNCALDPLYSDQCSMYQTAVNSCIVNPFTYTSCPGRTAAIESCADNGLTYTYCPTYQTEITYCNEDPLFNTLCSGYADAFFAQQCAIDGLYSNQCPNYGEAYAKKFILAVSPTVTSEPTPTTEVKVAEETSTPVAEVKAIESSPVSTASASPADTTAPVKLVSEPAASSSVAAASATSAKVEAPAAAAPAPATMRQQIAAQRQAAAREAAAESVKNNAGAMSAQMDSAASMEQQVELQNVVLGAMSFVAGFDAYGRVVLQDSIGYKPFTVYDNQKNVDNVRVMRGLSGASERLHSDMVDAQYK
jgi:hypothetical protein